MMVPSNLVLRRMSLNVFPIIEPTLPSGPTISEAPRHRMAVPSRSMTFMSTSLMPGSATDKKRRRFRKRDRSMGNTNLLFVTGLEKHAASTNRHSVARWSTIRTLFVAAIPRSLSRRCWAFRLPITTFRSARMVRIVAPFFTRPSDSSSSSWSFSVIIAMIDVALCAFTRTRSWILQGFPTRHTMSHPIRVRLGSIPRSAIASPSISSISSLVWSLAMTTTGDLATGLDGATLVHGIRRRLQDSF
mmetsp:Transcript_96996/g.277544  ORF Transcript_96996/g.277544 Transcript_96996/m.277544 type:complete len:245 (+) Transcript_96996:1595-2329(+)